MLDFGENTISGGIIISSQNECQTELQGRHFNLRTVGRYPRYFLKAAIRDPFLLIQFSSRSPVLSLAPPFLSCCAFSNTCCICLRSSVSLLLSESDYCSLGEAQHIFCCIVCAFASASPDALLIHGLHVSLDSFSSVSYEEFIVLLFGLQPAQETFLAPPADLLHPEYRPLSRS
jgi:hypothetical protein